MGFDTMSSYQRLSLYSAFVSPSYTDDTRLQRQDSCMFDSGRQRMKMLRHSRSSSRRSNTAMSPASTPSCINIPSFQATKAKWSPPPSPTSSIASPVSYSRPSTPRVCSASSTVSTTSSDSSFQGLDLNVLNSELFEASCSGDLAGIEILLDEGAAINSSTTVGGLFESFKPAKAGHLSPLAGAASFGHHAAVTLLLARGAELNPTSSQSASSPLHQAVRSNDYILVQSLLQIGADVNIDNAYKTTPIMYAVKYGSAELVSLVLTYGPDLSKVSFMNIAAIHWSVWPDNAAITELLLKAGADPNHPMSDGNTALHCAVLTGSLSMVRCLLRYGADAERPNSSWESPLTLAEAQLEHAEILLLLRAAIELRR